MNYHLTTISSNAKTGKIAVSTTSNESCPDSCSFKKGGCYAQGGPLALHWAKVSNGTRGVSFEGFLDQVRALPRESAFRHNQAGDLPGVNQEIDAEKLAALTTTIVSRRLRAWTYTHKPMNAENLRAVRAANAAGFTVNASADNIEKLDALKKLGVPTVVVLPADAPRSFVTPGGNKVVACPAQTREGVTCASCMLCHKGGRSVTVGFYAHGSGAKKVSAIAAG